MSYICLIEIQLHFPTGSSLKGKRKELATLKAQLQRRFGAAVSETDFHDLWQRSTMSAVLVGSDLRTLDSAATKLSRYVESCFPQGVRVERGIMSSDDVLGD